MNSVITTSLATIIMRVGCATTHSVYFITASPSFTHYTITLHYNCITVQPPSTTAGTVMRASPSGSPDTGAIIGGVVAIVFIVAVTICIIVTVIVIATVMRGRRDGSIPDKYVIILNIYNLATIL